MNTYHPAGGNEYFIDCIYIMSDYITYIRSNKYKKIEQEFKNLERFSPLLSRLMENAHHMEEINSLQSRSIVFGEKIQKRRKSSYGTPINRNYKRKYVLNNPGNRLESNGKTPLNMVELCRGYMDAIEEYKTKNKLKLPDDVNAYYTNTLKMTTNTLTDMINLGKNNDQAVAHKKSLLNLSFLRLQIVMHKMVEYKMQLDRNEALLNVTGLPPELVEVMSRLLV